MPGRSWVIFATALTAAVISHDTHAWLGRYTQKPAPGVALPREKGLPVPCLQLVDAGAVKAVMGEGFTPNAHEVFAGQSSCSWWGDPGQKPLRTFKVAFADRRAYVDRLLFFDAQSTAAGLFDFEFARAKAKAEPIDGVGVRAAAINLGTSTRLLVQRADGLISIDSSLPRAEMLALARRAASAPAPELGLHVAEPDLGPPVAVGPIDLDASARKEPCVVLLTSAEVQSIKRTEVLVDAIEWRPGLSTCEWRSSTSKQTGFLFTVASREEFATRKTASAAELLAVERKALTAAFQPEHLAGVGQEAMLVMVIATQPLIMLRRGEQVLTINCFGCSREQAIAIARLAAAK